MDASLQWTCIAFMILGSLPFVVFIRMLRGEPTAIWYDEQVRGFVTFLTAVCILDPIGRSRYEHTDKTKVRFREFDRRLAEAYLRHDEPYDCAGSFKLEGAGFVLFESVKTDDPTALIGMPMIWVADRLLQLGYLSPQKM